MTAYFITSSGTEIGKTYVTCKLIEQFRQQHQPVYAIKPIVSGFNEKEENDITHLCQALEIPYTTETIDQLSPWRFSAPLSPDMAANQEHKTIRFDDVVTHCQQQITLAKQNKTTILIEGIGGIMVPINNNHTIADLLTELSIPTILVVGSYLGSLSHTLTAYHTLTSLNIPIASVIVNEGLTPHIPLQDTITSLENFIEAPLVPLQKNQHTVLLHNTLSGIAA